MPRLRSSFYRLLPPLALTSLSLVALQPLLRADLPCSDDIGFHLASAAQIGQLLRDGHLYSRWAPNLARGLGLPLYNFYALLSAYLLAGVRLLGLAYPLAANLTFAALILAGGMGMWLFVRDRFGDVSGLLAAAAYVYAPYLAYDALFRGALAETTAWVWMPLALWAAGRAIRERRVGWAVGAAACYAALILSHNIVAVLFSPLLGGYLAVEWIACGGGRKRVGTAGLVLVGGLGLSAFFWLPALSEISFVQPAHVGSQFSADNFLSLAELLAPPQTADPSLLNPSPARGLGLVIAGLALLAVARWRALERRARLTVLYFLGALLVYGVLTLRVSAALWSALPPLQLVQFPWRLLAPAACAAAVLVGALTTRWRWAAAFSVAIVLADLYWLAPRYCPLGEAQPDVEFRRYGTTIGVDGAWEHLPAAVTSVAREFSLVEPIAAGVTPVRLPGAEPIDLDPLDARYHIDLAERGTLTYLTHDFPGWQVYLDGALLDHAPSPEHGLIMFDVPAGVHEVRVVFSDTPVRRVGNGTSIFTAGLLLWVVLRERRNPGVVPCREAETQFAPRPILMLAATGLALYVFKVAVVDRYPNPLRRPAYDGGQVVGAPQPLAVSLAGGVDLHGYAVEMVEPDRFDVTLYASVREDIDVPYLPTFIVVDAQGVRWSQTDTPIPPRSRGPHAASEWPTGEYALWTRRLDMLPGTPPGVYELYAAVYDLDTLVPDSIMGSGETRFRLGTITVPRSRRRPDLAALDVQHRAGTELAGGLALLGYSLDRDEAAPADPLLITTFWRSGQRLDHEMSLQIEMAAPESPARLLATQALHGGWLAGDLWREQLLVRMPADLVTGAYLLQMEVVGVPGASLPLGQIAITSPERTFTQPPVDRAVARAVFGQSLQLVGYSLAAEAFTPGGHLSLTLVWQALATPTASYRAFVHLQDGTGRSWAQHDSVPANWSRPTTGWLPGEYVVDQHALALPEDLPPGKYRVYVGLADLDTNQRLSLDGSDDDRLQLTTITWQP